MITAGANCYHYFWIAMLVLFQRRTFAINKIKKNVLYEILVEVWTCDNSPLFIQSFRWHHIGDCIEKKKTAPDLPTAAVLHNVYWLPNYVYNLILLLQSKALLVKESNHINHVRKPTKRKNLLCPNDKLLRLKESTKRKSVMCLFLFEIINQAKMKRMSWMR